MLELVKGLVKMGFINPVVLVRAIVPLINEKVIIVNEKLDDKLGVRRLLLKRLIEESVKGDEDLAAAVAFKDDVLDGVSEEEIDALTKKIVEVVIEKLAKN